MGGSGLQWYSIPRGRHPWEAKHCLADSSERLPGGCTFALQILFGLCSRFYWARFYPNFKNILFKKFCFIFLSLIVPELTSQHTILTDILLQIKGNVATSTLQISIWVNKEPQMVRWLQSLMLPARARERLINSASCSEQITYMGAHLEAMTGRDRKCTKAHIGSHYQYSQNPSQILSMSIADENRLKDLKL